MKKMNKVIAAMMLMAITFATPAMAGNRHHNHHNHHDKNVVVISISIRLTSIGTTPHVQT